MENSYVWTERYRPKKFEDVTGQHDIVRRLKALVEQKNIPHLLFSGPAGVGKTTLALVIARELYGDDWKQNFLELNASNDRGIDVIRNEVKDFAKTKGLANIPFKLILLDECDALTKEAQQALRRTMETYSSSCRFVLSCNFVNKVIEKTKAIFFERRENYENKRQSLVNQRTAWEAKRKTAENKLFERILSDEDFTRVRNEINTELGNIAQMLSELENQRETNVDIAQEILLFTKDIYKTFKKASFQLKRHHLGFFWSRFETYDKVIIKSVPSPLFQELLNLKQVAYKLPNFEKLVENNKNNKVIISNVRGD